MCSSQSLLEFYTSPQYFEISSIDKTTKRPHVLHLLPLFYLSSDSFLPDCICVAPLASTSLLTFCAHPNSTKSYKLAEDPATSLLLPN